MPEQQGYTHSEYYVDVAFGKEPKTDSAPLPGEGEVNYLDLAMGKEPLRTRGASNPPLIGSPQDKEPQKTTS